jgi:hypothetical protein
VPEYTVSCDEPEPATDVGLNEALAPEGTPVTLRFTVLLNPFVGATVAV